MVFTGDHMNIPEKIDDLERTVGSMCGNRSVRWHKSRS